LVVGWETFLFINSVCFFLPFVLAVLHYAFYNGSKGKYRFLWLSSSYFMAVNVVFKTFFLGVFRIFWGHLSANFEHLSYSPIFTEYGVLILSISFFGLIALFSRSMFRVAPSILFGMFLLLVSFTHWVQLDSHLLLAPSRHYLLIIFDILTAIVLFYHAWKLNKSGLLEASTSSKKIISFK
jgi:hypothetical protein